jgi:hypothetical protein
LAVSKAGLTANSWLSKHASDAENMSKMQAIPLSIASAVAKKTEAAADSGNVAAKLAHAAANWVLTSSMPPLLVITLILVAAMAVLIAIIAAVVAVVKGLSDAYNADAIAAEKAAEAAEDLGKAAEKAKEKVDELKNSWSSYEEALYGLNKLKTGTDEWYQSL